MAIADPPVAQVPYKIEHHPQMGSGLEPSELGMSIELTLVMTDFLIRNPRMSPPAFSTPSPLNLRDLGSLI